MPGPSTASNVVVSDSLPLDLTFVVQRPPARRQFGRQRQFGDMAEHVRALPVRRRTTNYTVTRLRASVAGMFTNPASALSSTYDPNPTNNSGVSAGRAGADACRAVSQFEHARRRAGPQSADRLV